MYLFVLEAVAVLLLWKYRIVTRYTITPLARNRLLQIEISVILALLALSFIHL